MFVKNDINELNLNKIQDDEMALSEHIEEFSQRIIFCLILLLISTLLCFTDIKQIVQIFQIPAMGIKFLQFAPGEYFFASVKIAAFCGILLSSPITIYQIFLYIVEQHFDNNFVAKTNSNKNNKFFLTCLMQKKNCF